MGEKLIEIDGGALPRCVRCGHRACPDCFATGIDWCDDLDCIGCDDSECSYDREYEYAERQQILVSLKLPEGRFILVNM